jgi:hypothetical protein
MSALVRVPIIGEGLALFLKFDFLNWILVSRRTQPGGAMTGRHVSVQTAGRRCTTCGATPRAAIPLRADGWVRQADYRPFCMSGL